MNLRRCEIAEIRTQKYFGTHSELVSVKIEAGRERQSNAGLHWATLFRWTTENMEQFEGLRKLKRAGY